MKFGIHEGKIVMYAESNFDRLILSSLKNRSIKRIIDTTEEWGSGVVDQIEIQFLAEEETWGT